MRFRWVKKNSVSCVKIPLYFLTSLTYSRRNQNKSNYLPFILEVMTEIVCSRAPQLDFASQRLLAKDPAHWHSTGSPAPGTKSTEPLSRNVTDSNKPSTGFREAFLWEKEKTELKAKKPSNSLHFFFFFFDRRGRDQKHSCSPTATANGAAKGVGQVRRTLDLPFGCSCLIVCNFLRVALHKTLFQEDVVNPLKSNMLVVNDFINISATNPLF